MSKRNLAFLVVVLSLLLFFAGCDGSNSVTIDGDSTDGDTTDGDSTDGDETDGDLPDDGDVDVTDGDGTGGCTYAEECGTKEDCVEGECVAATKCQDYDECEPNEICYYESREAAVGYCRDFCATDMDCPDEAWCKNGLCKKYVAIPEGTPPAKHPEWDGKLHGGYAEGFLQFPFGTTMQGYGLRKGPNGPYNVAMGAATGIYDRLMVKALTLDDGEDRAVFVQLPLCFPTDFLVTGIVKEVIAMGGPDLADNLILTATHTHSGPGRFWYLLPSLGFGSLGFGEFSYEAYKTISSSIAKVVYDAQQEIRPVAFGYGINDNFDPDDKINRDRRSENDHFKDPRLVVWRIDDLSSGEAKPWVVTLSYATHGTVEDQPDTFYTDDSAGGAANMTQLLYEKDHPGERIHSMFFNGMAGDVSPSGGLATDHSAQDMLIGYRVYPLVMDLFNSIVPSSDVDISVISKRVPIDRDYVGYAEDEFYSDGVSFGEFPPGGPLRFGAFQCGMLNTPVEENLDLFVYDTSGELIKSSEAANTNADGEEVKFTPHEDGVYTIKVAGVNGTMNNYSLIVTPVARGLQLGDECIDASCGLACGECINRKDLTPLECSEDALEDNDDPSTATEIQSNTRVENLQVCPFDEDWFKVELPADQRVAVSLQFNQNDGAYNPASRIHDGQLGCVLVVERMNHGPVPQFNKTRFTSILFDIKDPNDGSSRTLYLGGLPGEPTSRIGLDTVNEVLANTDYDDVLVFGYTNDHHFYLTAEDDWFQGGYNTTMSIWGYKFGQFLINHLKDLAVAISEDRVEEAANEFEQVKALNFQDIEEPLRVPFVTDMPTDASVVTQPVDVKRAQTQTVFEWIGGDPGADWPVTYLERKNESGEFEQVFRESGQIFDDRFYEMKLEFFNEKFRLPNKPDADTNNYWKITYEETKDFPLGTYRFRSEGKYYEGPTDSYDGVTGVEPYTIYSEPFDVLPNDLEVQNIQVADGGVSGSVRYHRPPMNDDGVSPFDSIQNKALMIATTAHEIFVPPQVLADDVADVQIAILTEGGDEVAEEVTDIQWNESTGDVFYVSSRDEEGNETIGTRGGNALTVVSGSLPDLAPGNYVANINVTDVYGNTGTSTSAFVVQ